MARQVSVRLWHTIRWSGRGTSGRSPASAGVIEVQMSAATNGSESIAALLADIDGTVVTKDKVLTERAKAAARRLRERGIIFTVTSGRPPRGMRMLVEPLGLTM